jgi:hypothetical protein
MRLMTNRVEAMIGLRHCGNVVRGVVEFCFSLTIPRIEDSRGLAGVDFVKILCNCKEYSYPLLWIKIKYIYY